MKRLRMSNRYKVEGQVHTISNLIFETFLSLIQSYHGITDRVTYHDLSVTYGLAYLFTYLLY